MEDKLGVFICSGYGIAAAIDIEALSKVATDVRSCAFELHAPLHLHVQSSI